MLSRRLVLPERYGPHSATTRCAPLPGLPPVMVSVLMSFMTTSSLLRRSCAEKLRTMWSHPNSTAGAKPFCRSKCFHSEQGESIGERGKIFALLCDTVDGRDAIGDGSPLRVARRPNDRRQECNQEPVRPHGRLGP